MGESLPVQIPTLDFYDQNGVHSYFHCTSNLASPFTDMNTPGKLHFDCPIKQLFFLKMKAFHSIFAFIIALSFYKRDIYSSYEL